MMHGMTIGVCIRDVKRICVGPLERRPHYQAPTQLKCPVNDWKNDPLDGLNRRRTLPNGCQPDLIAVLAGSFSTAKADQTRNPAPYQDAAGLLPL